jgi:hypothetical protein
MSSLLIKFFGINWKTTILGWSAIVALIGKIGLAWRTKDIAAILNNGQELLLDISILLGGIGLIKAKDGNTVGAGTSAIKIHKE